LKKSKFEKTDIIYRDTTLSEQIFFIYKGIIKLYAENNYPFYTFNNGNTCGDSDMFCNIRRIGNAVAMEDTMLYSIQKH